MCARERERDRERQREIERARERARVRESNSEGAECLHAHVFAHISLSAIDYIAHTLPTQHFAHTPTTDLPLHGVADGPDSFPFLRAMCPFAQITSCFRAVYAISHH